MRSPIYIKEGQKLPENLPRVEVVYDIPERGKVCACGGEMSRIGEDVSERLDIIPAVIRVIRQFNQEKPKNLQDAASIIRPLRDFFDKVLDKIFLFTFS